MARTTGKTGLLVTCCERGEWRRTHSPRSLACIGRPYGVPSADMAKEDETEVWFRNPDNYIRELVEVGQYWITWDRGLLFKKRLDPKKHADLYFGKTFDYRILVVGDQGTAEIRQNSTMENPTAVYPTFMYGEAQALLEEMVEFPAGEDADCCTDLSVEPDLRPVWGQEHRVVITDLPNLNTGPGRKFIRYLKELQEEYPKCIIHLHGTYSHRMAFGTGLGAADVAPRDAAQKGKVVFPSGKEEKYERAQANPQWVTVLGFTPKDLEVPRNRCMYNIKSAVWAGKHYNQLYNFKVRKPAGFVADSTSSDNDFKPEVTNSHRSTPVKAKSGDKMLCNTCSLQTTCKYFREGSVCTLPDAEPKALAAFFNTRNADLIIDGLGTLMAAGTRRLERGMQEEEAFGETNPEVTKMMGQIFGQGVQLAKLLDPSLSGGPKVQIAIGNVGASAVATADPKQLVSAAFRELESRGIRREDITPDMIQGLLSGMAQPDVRMRAIEGVAMEVTDK